MAATDRLAPCQIDKPLPDLDSEDGGGGGGGDYNIWYHAKPGKRKRRAPERGVAARTRCVPDLHEGRTKAGSASDICLFFARGCCHLGFRCNRRHRLPTHEVELALDVQRDCFGRAREATEGDDQNGPGSVLKENTTLFVGNCGAESTEAGLRAAFAPFGPIAQVRFQPAKSLGFVQFRWRASAEFAKEAMSQQVDGGDASFF